MKISIAQKKRAFAVIIALVAVTVLTLLAGAFAYAMKVETKLAANTNDDEKQYPLVLAKNVKEFKIEWWGTNNLNEAGWNTDWDDTQTNTIPQMLRVHLVMGANTARGQNAPDFAATHIYTVPSQMMPVVVQRGLGGQR